MKLRIKGKTKSSRKIVGLPGGFTKQMVVFKVEESCQVDIDIT